MICQTKPELCSYILKYQESAQRMLPVVIQGSSVGIRHEAGRETALSTGELVEKYEGLKKELQV